MNYLDPGIKFQEADCDFDKCVFEVDFGFRLDFDEMEKVGKM